MHSISGHLSGGGSTRLRRYRTRVATVSTGYQMPTGGYLLNVS